MSRRKTHEEYVQEVAVMNPSVEVVGEYINSGTKLMHFCKIHNVYWESIPTNILKGAGCNICHVEKCKAKKTRSNEDYLQALINNNINIIPLESYVDCHTKILHKCTKHNYEWLVSPDNVLRGHGCYLCGNEKISSKNKRSHDEYISLVTSLNSNIIVLGEYIDSLTPIAHKCLIDDFEWCTAPVNILSGKGCPKCAGNIKKSHIEYISELSVVNNDIIVVGEYINARTPIEHMCKIDGFVWMAQPTSVLSGCGCPKCAGNIKKSHEEYLREVQTINSDIEVIDGYINANTPIKHRCKLDGFIWSVSPYSIINGCGCPQCNETIGERQIRQWLTVHNIEYEFQKRFVDCCDIHSLPFDFYLPKFNTVIEYDGKQHFEPICFFGGEDKFKITVKHDDIKNNYCANNNIRIIRILYSQNVETILNNSLLT